MGYTHHLTEQGVILPVHTRSPQSHQPYNGLPGIMGPCAEVMNAVNDVIRTFGRQHLYTANYMAVKHSYRREQKVDLEVALKAMHSMGFTDRLGRHGQGLLEPITASNRPHSLRTGIGYDQSLNSLEQGRQGPTVSGTADQQTEQFQQWWILAAADEEVLYRQLQANTKANSGLENIDQLRLDWAEGTGEALAMRACDNYNDVTFSDHCREEVRQRIQRRTANRRADRTINMQWPQQEQTPRAEAVEVTRGRDEQPRKKTKRGEAPLEVRKQDE